MSPQLYQSIQLMALPIQDLQQKIAEEIEKNPALELVENSKTLSLDDLPVRKSDDYDPFENSSDPGYSRAPDTGEDTKRKFLEGAVSRKESLQDHLLWQLHVTVLSDREVEIGELLIRNLDSNGFHLEDPHSLVKEGEYDLLEHMIHIVQEFDPQGVCAKDHLDSLLVQAHLREDYPEGIDQLLTEFFELLEKGKYNEIIKQMKITREDWENMIQFLQTLNPYPGVIIRMHRITYVIPDIVVKKKEGEFVIVLNDEEIPVMRINSFFEDIQDGGEAAGDKQVKQFVNGRVRDARWFINSVNQRNQTLLKTATAILEFQREFFRKGAEIFEPSHFERCCWRDRCS